MSVFNFYFHIDTVINIIHIPNFKLSTNSLKKHSKMHITAMDNKELSHQIGVASKKTKNEFFFK